MKMRFFTSVAWAATRFRDAEPSLAGSPREPNPVALYMTGNDLTPWLHCPEPAPALRRERGYSSVLIQPPSAGIDVAVM